MQVVDRVSLKRGAQFPVQFPMFPFVSGWISALCCQVAPGTASCLNIGSVQNAGEVTKLSTDFRREIRYTVYNWLYFWDLGDKYNQFFNLHLWTSLLGWLLSDKSIGMCLNALRMIAFIHAKCKWCADNLANNSWIQGYALVSQGTVLSFESFSSLCLYIFS